MAENELGFLITSNAESAVDGLDKVNSALERIEKVIDGITDKLNKSDGIDRLVNAIDKLNPDKIKSVSDAMDKVSTDTQKAAESVSKAMDGIGKETEKVSEQLKKTGENNGLDKAAENIEDIKNKTFDAATDIKKATDSIQESSEKITKTNSWSQVFEGIQNLKGEYDKLKDTIGETNAKLQIAQEIHNRINKAFADTKSGKMFFDTENMQRAEEILKTVDTRLESFRNNLKDPIKVDVSEPVNNIEKLYARLKELKNYISDMKNNKINFTDDQFLGALKEYESVQKQIEQINKSISSNAKPDTWKDVIKDVEQMQADFEKLANTVGENNAAMQNLQDIHNRLTKAFSDTKSGKMLFDIDNMQKAQSILNVVDDKLNQFQEDLKDPMGLRLDASQPVNDIEKLYARLHELQDFISRMKSNKINFTDDQFKNALKEYDEVKKKINDIEKPKAMEKANSGALEFMATVIALQHELDKVAGILDKFGNIATKAFKKALTPLKLFEHEFDHIKTMVTRIGSAFAMISKPITKVFNDMQKKWTQALSTMEKRMNKLMRTFVYMGFRKIFTAIYKTMGEAIKSLAAFSKSINTDFNYSMSLLTSDLRYLGASIVAAFEPLINFVVPILDKFVDVLVAAINKLNMFFAALTGAKSFTIAKKKIVDYTDAMNKASKAAKQLTMGIDELNILNDKSGSDSDLDDLFDWQEIDSSAIPKSIKDAADKVKDIAKQLWNPIAEAWDKVGDYVKRSFKRMLDSIGALLKDIGRDFLEVWNQPRTVHMLEQILGILGDIFNIIANIADGWREAWNYNETGKKMLEDIRDLFDVIFTHIHNITSAMVEWTAQLDWKPLFVAIEYALSKLVYAIDQIGYVVEDLSDLFMKLGTYLIEDWAPRLIKVFGDVEEGIGNIAKQIHKAWQEVDFGTKVADGIDGIMQEILPHLEELGKYFKEWANGIDFKPLMNAFTDLLESMKPLADFVSGTLVEAFEKLFLEEIEHLVEEIIPKIIKAFSDFNNAVNFDKLREQMSKLIDAAQHLQHAISGGVADAIGKLGQHLAKFVNSKDFNDFLDNIAKFVSKIKPEMISKVLEGIGLAILKIAEGLVKFVNSEPFQNFLDSLIRFMENTSANKIADILLGIAKAILVFKGASAAIKAISSISSVLPILIKLAEILSPTGLLVLGLVAAGAAFVLFGDQIAAIDWTALGKKIYDGIIGLVEKIDWEKVGQNLAKVVGDILALAIETVLNPAWQARIWGIIANIVVSIVKGLGDGIFNGLIKAFENAGLDVVAGFLRGIKTAWDAIWDFIGSLIQKFIDFVKGILGIHSPSTVFAEIGTDIVLGLIEGIKAAWEGLVEFFTTCWETVKTVIIEAWEGIKEAVLLKWEELKTAAVEKWNEITSTISQIWTDFKEIASEKWESIKETIYEKWQNVATDASTKWNEISETIGQIWDTLKTSASEKWQAIREAISEKWENIKSDTLQKWDNIKSELSAKWEQFKSDASALWEGIKKTISEVWDGIQSKWDATWSSIKSAIESWWNQIKTSAKTGWDEAVNFVKTLWDGIKNAWDSIWKSIEQTVSGWWATIRKNAQNGWDKAVDFVKTLWNSVKTTWDTRWNEIHSAMSTLWNKVKTTAFDIWNGASEKIAKVWDGVKSAWETVWNGILGTIKNVVNNIIGGIEKLVNGAIDGLNWLIEKANAIPGIDINLIPKINIPKFATGGFPEDGLFMANHNELVGKFSNGQTAVVNNQQITDGIREAVASAMIPILEEIAVNTRETADKDMTLSVDSREIARANNTGQTKLGKPILSFT